MNSQTARRGPFSGLVDFLRNRNGNYSVLFAIMVPVMLGAAGIGIDFTTAMNLKSRLSDAADAAAAAAASSMLHDGLDAKEAEKLAITYFKAQLENEVADYGGFTIDPAADAKTVIGPKKQKTYRVVVTSTAKTPYTGLSKFLYSKPLELKTKSVAESAPEQMSALSMFLVLDKSGSMGWDNKMASLKVAVGKLAAQLTKAEAEGQTEAAKKGLEKKVRYVRTGAVAYDIVRSKPRGMNWGTTHTVAYANALKARGGTNSQPAMSAAYWRIRRANEAKFHTKESGQSNTKFIVFMTDGANNKADWDKKTLRWCTRAKNENILIYTIAFKAPKRGKDLLSKCATPGDYYFDAASSDALIKAFERIGQSAAQLMARIAE